MMMLIVKRHGHVYNFKEELAVVWYCQSPRSRQVPTFTYRRHLFSVWYCQSSDSPDMYILSPTECTCFQYDIVNRL